jgi:hypothetical protein
VTIQKEYGKLTYGQFGRLVRRLPEIRSQMAELPKLANFRFHALRHTWASWHRQSGTTTDELKDLGGWKPRVMMNRYGKFATEHLTVAAARIESGLSGINVANNVAKVMHFPYSGEKRLGRDNANYLNGIVAKGGIEPPTHGFSALFKNLNQFSKQRLTSACQFPSQFQSG